MKEITAEPLVLELKIADSEIHSRRMQCPRVNRRLSLTGGQPSFLCCGPGRVPAGQLGAICEQADREVCGWDCWVSEAKRATSLRGLVEFIGHVDDALSLYPPINGYLLEGYHNYLLVSSFSCLKTTLHLIKSLHILTPPWATPSCRGECDIALT